MANRNHMQVVPIDRFERAEWMDARLHKLLRQRPLAAGIQGLAQLEEQVFPRPCVLPLDPACPECGLETEDGSVQRVGDLFRIFYDCGHWFEVTEVALQGRMRDGRNA